MSGLVHKGAAFCLDSYHSRSQWKLKIQKIKVLHWFLVRWFTF